MKSATKLGGIAAAVASLLATGAAGVQGHSVDATASIALADKECHSKKGCEKKESKKEGEHRENEHKE